MENILQFKREKNKVDSFSSKYEKGIFIISFWNRLISYLFHTPTRNSTKKNIDLMDNNKKITYIENIITLYYFILIILNKGMEIIYIILFTLFFYI